MEDVAVFEIDIEDLHDSTDVSDDNATCPSLACLPEGLSHSLKFKTHLFEVIEELRLRRVTDHDNENRFKQLVREKHDLAKQYEEAASKIRLAEKEHSHQIAEISRSLDTKMKELIDQQARQSVSLEIAESEGKLLKDEIRKLQLSKYSLEKQVRELELKLQLQTTINGSGLVQVAELESMCTAVFKDVSRLGDYMNRLDASVQDATSTNKKLSYLCYHQQQCVINEQSIRIADLQRNVADTKVALASCHADRSDSLMHTNIELQSVQLELESSKEEIAALEQLLNIKSIEVEKSTRVLQESHVLIKQHIEASEIYKSESKQLGSQLADMESRFSCLQKQYDETLEKFNINQELYKTMVSEHETQVQGYIERLTGVDDRYQELLRSYSDLEELNSQWSQKNIDLLEQIAQLKSLLFKDTVDVFVATEISLLDEETQTASVDYVTQSTMTSNEIVLHPMRDVAVQTSFTDVQQPVPIVDCSMQLNSAETHKQSDSSCIISVVANTIGLSETEKQSNVSCSIAGGVFDVEKLSDVSRVSESGMSETQLPSNSSYIMAMNNTCQWPVETRLSRDSSGSRDVSHDRASRHVAISPQSLFKVDSDSDVTSFIIKDLPAALVTKDNTVTASKELMHSVIGNESVYLCGIQRVSSIEPVYSKSCQLGITAEPVCALDSSPGYNTESLVSESLTTVGVTDPVLSLSSAVADNQSTVLPSEPSITVTCQSLMAMTTTPTTPTSRSRSITAMTVAPVFSSNTVTGGGQHTALLCEPVGVVASHSAAVIVTKLCLSSALTNQQFPMLATDPANAVTIRPVTVAVTECLVGESLPPQIVTSMSDTSVIRKALHSAFSWDVGCSQSADGDVALSQGFNHELSANPGNSSPAMVMSVGDKFQSFEWAHSDLECVKNGDFNGLRIAECSLTVANYRSLVSSKETQLSASVTAPAWQGDDVDDVIEASPKVRLPASVVTTGLDCISTSFMTSASATFMTSSFNHSGSTSQNSQFLSVSKSALSSQTVQNRSASDGQFPCHLNTIRKNSRTSFLVPNRTTATSHYSHCVPNNYFPMQSHQSGENPLNKYCTSQLNSDLCRSTASFRVQTSTPSKLCTMQIDSDSPAPTGEDLVSCRQILKCVSNSQMSTYNGSERLKITESRYFKQLEGDSIHEDLSKSLNKKELPSCEILFPAPVSEVSVTLNNENTASCGTVFQAPVVSEVSVAMNEINKTSHRSFFQAPVVSAGSVSLNTEKASTGTLFQAPFVSEVSVAMNEINKTSHRSFFQAPVVSAGSVSLNTEKASTGTLFQAPVVSEVSVTIDEEKKASHGTFFQAPVSDVSMTFNKENKTSYGRLSQMLGSDLSVTRPRVKRPLFTCKGPLMIDSTEASPQTGCSSHSTKTLPSMLRDAAEPTPKKVKRVFFSGLPLQFTTDQDKSEAVQVNTSDTLRTEH